MTSIRTVDYHTGGEPFRIVTGGVAALEDRPALEGLDTAGDNPKWLAARVVVDRPDRGHLVV